MNNSQKNTNLEETKDFKTETKWDERDKKMEELEEKIQNVEKNIQNTVSHSIKSIGYISIVISLGLTAIVSFVGLAMNKASFEWWQFLIGIFIIFSSMLMFFVLSIKCLFKQAKKYNEQK